MPTICHALYLFMEYWPETLLGTGKQNRHAVCPHLIFTLTLYKYVMAEKI